MSKSLYLCIVCHFFLQRVGPPIQIENPLSVLGKKNTETRQILNIFFVRSWQVKWLECFEGF